jgi:hypothetical protein
MPGAPSIVAQIAISADDQPVADKGLRVASARIKYFFHTAIQEAGKSASRGRPRNSEDRNLGEEWLLARRRNEQT